MSNRKEVLVVGIDFGHASELALRRALRQAYRAPAACVIAVWVDEGFDPMGVARLAFEAESAGWRASKERLQRWVLERAEAVLAEEGIVAELDRVEAQARFGSAADELVAVAGSSRASLLLIGAPRKGMRLASSTAARVVREAPCPVLVERAVRATPQEHTTVDAPAADLAYST